MTDQPTPAKSRISTADVKQKSKGFSPVWVIPIIAALVGGWMVFQNLPEENAKIEVTFKSAAGLEAGKTQVKVRDIVVGKVTDVDFSKDLGVVNVEMEFEGICPEHITDKTRFWVIKPRIGAGGVSGLDTLLSGAYIEADPGEGGEPATKFTGMEEPGNYQLGNPGTKYRLEASTLGSLSRGSPIKYRDVAVGQVTRYKLAEDSVAVDIEIFIRAPYDKLVKKDTRFWNISGLEVEAGAEGFKLEMASIATLISGGIAFSAIDSSSGAQAEADSIFTLYKHEGQQAVAEEVAFYVPIKLYFENGVKGLDAGAPVEYKGLRLGTVEKVTAELSEDKTDMTTIAAVRIEPDRLPEESNNRGKSREFRTKLVHDFLEVLVNHGVRAQLKTGNLLTGKALIEFSKFPDAEPDPVRYVNGLAIFPTMPESLANIAEKVDGITTKINQILAKIDAIPITEIGNNLATTTAKINKIPMEEIGNNMADLTAKLEAIPTGKIGKDLADTMESLQGLIDSLNAAKGGVLGVQTRRALAEITRAATALRGMAEYLERHPEALLKGKN
ncbi:MAG: MCE family protein [Xanthomonadales bacterium]|nr:MCE family protein [Xanthomonadales bacterium]